MTDLISNLRIKARPYVETNLSNQRALKAAQYLIAQINLGELVDYKYVLRQFKVHPQQKMLYENATTNPRPISKLIATMFKADNNNAA